MYDELQFKIINITSERRINGIAKIHAVCIGYDLNIQIEIPGSLINDKEFIRQQLKDKAISIISKKANDIIKIGDII